MGRSPVILLARLPIKLKVACSISLSVSMFPPSLILSLSFATGSNVEGGREAEGGGCHAEELVEHHWYEVPLADEASGVGAGAPFRE